MRLTVLSTIWAFLLCAVSATIYESLEDKALGPRTESNCPCEKSCCESSNHHCDYVYGAVGWSCIPNIKDTSSIFTYPTTMARSSTYSSAFTLSSWTSSPTFIAKSSSYSSSYTHESSWTSIGVSTGKVMPTTAYTATTKGVTGKSTAWSGTPSLTLASAQSTFLAKNTTSVPDTLLPTGVTNATSTLSLTTKSTPTQGSIVATTTNNTSTASLSGLWSWSQIMLVVTVATALLSLL
ncbi:hypothetical protein B0J14DRAFT_302419 [Halenospora varia]|nr:hypothetical protein B0J14DRAFT_302419 [Halenospora varia]